MNDFQLTKFMDVGTGNPIVARLMPGMDKIIQMAQISEEEKTVVTECIFDVMRSLIQAEKAAKPLMEEIRQAQENLVREGIKTQNNGRIIQTPGVMLLDNARTFLKYSKQALQSLAKALGVLLEKKFDGSHFQLVLKRAKEHLGESHPATKLLEEDQKWLKDINDLRNEEEHCNTGKPFVEGFSISTRPDGNYLVDVPRFFNDMPILNCLEVFSHNLLTFSEEIMVHTLEGFLPKMISIYEIPEGERNYANPIRYRLGLKEEVCRPSEKIS